MKIHVHDNTTAPDINCLGEYDLEPGKDLTLHITHAFPRRNRAIDAQTQATTGR